MAEDAARELPNLALEDALQLVRLYADRGSPKYEKAAVRWLERYLTAGSPRLRHFAKVAADWRGGTLGTHSRGCGSRSARRDRAALAARCARESVARVDARSLIGLASYLRIEERELEAGAEFLDALEHGAVDSRLQ
jgi:hypothetical protein